MFEQALKADIPIIGVQTDDIVNFELVLAELAKPKIIRPWPTTKQVSLQDTVVYWTEDAEQATPENYRRVAHAGTQIVVLNCPKGKATVFDAGELPTPQKFLENYLHDLVSPEQIDRLMPLIKGMSIKSASEVVQLAAATFGEITPTSVNAMKVRLSGGSPGLYPMNTDIEFWVCPPQIEHWLQLNKEYIKPGVNPMLMPRGLLLSGPPGVGKTMACRAIASTMGLPAFRLDIATTLNKFIGQSESHLARSLDLLDRSAPCVALIDEVEKVFTGEDQGTTQRMLAQLLWWMQERQAPVVMVLTTNNINLVPPPLYRPGRIDRVIELRNLDLEGARDFALKMFKTIVGKSPTMKQQQVLRESFQTSGDYAGFSHALVCEVVSDQVKAHGWAPALECKI